MFYPIIFEPIYKHMVWGGSRFAEMFGRELPFERVGESWDVSCRPDDMGTVRNGQMRGTAFERLIGADPPGYLGKALCGRGEFPLLIKLIDANDDLSVQVHPPWKNEIWYVIHAPEGARLNAGLVSGTRKEDFATGAESNTGEIEKYLNYIPVKAGDVINIPAGSVHAICAGLVIAEIQQNSNSTYRIYDYGRVDKSGNPRQLHIEQALEAIDFNSECGLLRGQATDVPGGRIVFFIETEHYALYEYFVETSIQETSDPDRFYIFTCVCGSCEIRSAGHTERVTAGDSVFIPAALGAYEIAGKCRLLKSLVP